MRYLGCYLYWKLLTSLLVQPLGWTLCLYWVACLRRRGSIRAFEIPCLRRRGSIYGHLQWLYTCAGEAYIRAFDGNDRLLAKITAPPIENLHVYLSVLIYILVRKFVSCNNLFFLFNKRAHTNFVILSYLIQMVKVWPYCVWPGTYILKGHASLPKSPLIGGLFTCHKNPSAPSALSRPLNVYGVWCASLQRPEVVSRRV